MYDLVKDYYGRQLQSSEDLKTSACCDASDMPAWLKPLLARIHPEVTARYYGCGLVCPPLLEGCQVLDLGCGSGRDVYALAQLAGAQGHVVGVDMTEEQLAVAEQYRAHHGAQFGFENITFRQGYIERLEALGLASGRFDVIVSNCVINLSPDKDAVLREVHRLLKPGGEFYFSDVYADRRVPDAVREDPVLYGECLGGALYGNDFLRLARRHGFLDPRLLTDRPLDVTDPKLAARIGDIRFYSATYRLFKVEGLEATDENYGQTVLYRGSVPHHACRFELDRGHRMPKGQAVPVGGNTWRMLQASRFAPHFEFTGNFDHHLGPFQAECLPSPDQATPSDGACC